MSQTPLQGYQVQIGYAQETTFGTAPTVGSYNAIGYNPSVTPKTEQGWISIYTLGSKDVQSFVPGKLLNEIRIEYHPIDITFAQYAIGNIALSFAVWIQVSTLNLVYSGCKINSIKFETRVGEPTKITCVVQAAQISIGAPGTATLPSAISGTPMYFGTNVSVVQKTNGGGNVTLPALDCEAEITNNLEWIGVLGQRYARSLLEKNRMIKGSVNITFNVTDPSQWMNSSQILSPTDFSLTWQIGKDTGGTTRTLSLGTPASGSGCQWENQEVPLKPTDLIYVKYPFLAKTVSLA